MKEPLASLPEEARDRLRRERLPGWVSPMLATLTDDRFSSEDWIYERRLRHPRCLGLRDDKDPREVHRKRPQHG